jgi:threonine/homoserine/homoserine lactone efflux protein
MIDRAHFLIFLAAAIILAVSPGPGMIFALARSLRGGRAVGQELHSSVSAVTWQ